MIQAAASRGNWASHHVTLILEKLRRTTPSRDHTQPDLHQTQPGNRTQWVVVQPLQDPVGSPVGSRTSPMQDPCDVLKGKVSGWTPLIVDFPPSDWMR